MGAVLAQVRASAGETPRRRSRCRAAPRAKVSPAARRRAHELGVDPDRLHGTGADGAVTLADVERPGPSCAGTGVARRRPHAVARARRPRARAPAGFDAAADAPGDRRRDEPLQARDPALLPRRARSTSRAASAWLEAYNRDRAARGAAAAGGAAAQGHGAGAGRGAAAQRLLRERTPSGRAPASTSAGPSRCAAAAWWRRRSTMPTASRCPS